MRTAFMPVGPQDTCRFDVHVPYHLLLRLHENNQPGGVWNVVLVQEKAEDILLHEVTQPGGYQFRGQIVTASFPFQLELTQSNNSNAETTTLVSTGVPFHGAQTVVVKAWSNVADVEL